jgi:hypothetical protein
LWRMAWTVRAVAVVARPAARIEESSTHRS